MFSYLDFIKLIFAAIFIYIKTYMLFLFKGKLLSVTKNNF